MARSEHMRFIVDVITTKIPDVKIIKPKIFGDERGSFYEFYHLERYRDLVGVNNPFIQDNLSRSVKGTLRGLHFQSQYSQGKLVSVLAGRVFDVAVDVRRDSPTFGQWVSVELSEENRYQLWIPPGFCHGFYVLSEVAEFYYKCTDYYHPEFEITIRYDDPDLDIPWPLFDSPVLSEKDKNGVNIASLAQDLFPYFDAEGL